ncbi:hypothetical protein K1T71_012258 [Dendrolimus kikuchii]|uniref:Uncharacterized protein n=1 Tax=Dendrolimus kikuchii TaxID=765133 RepID=A0ACC1CLA3_9NEOP|nr:hypothetical protein K1T71_012258 [Dendrolimus kikuchii]
MMLYLGWTICCFLVQVHAENRRNIIDPERLYFEDNIPILKKFRILTGLERDYLHLASSNMKSRQPEKNPHRAYTTYMPQPHIPQKNLKKDTNNWDRIVFRDDDDETDITRTYIDLRSKPSISTDNINNLSNKKEFKENNDFVPNIIQNFNSFKQNTAGVYPNALSVEVSDINLQTGLNDTYNTYPTAGDNTIKNSNLYENSPVLVEPNNVDNDTVNLSVMKNLTNNEIFVSEDLDLSVLDTPVTPNIDLSVFDVSDAFKDIDLSVFDEFDESSKKPFTETQNTDSSKAVNNNSGFEDLDISVFDSVENNNITTTTSYPWNLDLSIYDEFKKNSTTTFTDT